MKQKFGMLSFVRVKKDLPVSYRHFTSDFDAIVQGTYSQLFGGSDIKSYSLYQLENGKIYNRIAWYKEEFLDPLPEQDRDKAERMIEEYNLKRTQPQES